MLLSEFLLCLNDLLACLMLIIVLKTFIIALKQSMRLHIYEDSTEASEMKIFIKEVPLWKCVQWELKGMLQKDHTFCVTVFVIPLFLYPQT